MTSTKPRTPRQKTATYAATTFFVGLFALTLVLTLLPAFKRVGAQSSGAPLVISEFRLRGPNGANDEFIEIYNNSGTDHTVADGGAGVGYAIVASDGVVRCVIPNGTIIPAGGHYLCVNSIGYSLAAYPAGNGTTATGDATYTTNINDNAGIALFNTSVAADFTLANRFDAVGSTSEANTLYKEGAGYPALTPFSIDYSFYRSYCPRTFCRERSPLQPRRPRHAAGHERQRRGLRLRRHERDERGRGPAPRRARPREPFEPG